MVVISVPLRLSWAESPAGCSLEAVAPQTHHICSLEVDAHFWHDFAPGQTTHLYEIKMV